jgi:hypothetical protein
MFIYSPRDVCRSRVIKVDKPGHKQLLAKSAYLNSSSTICSFITIYNYFKFFKDIKFISLKISYLYAEYAFCFQVLTDEYTYFIKSNKKKIKFIIKVI